jgi:hypothetical protein
MAKSRAGHARFWWDILGIRPVWVEITRRPNDDIGVDINHDNKRTFPLLESARKGDFVLHWDSKRGCFVGRSRITDSAVYSKDGSRFRDLTDFVQFPETALTLDALRSNHAKIRAAKERLEGQIAPRLSLLFPLAPYARTWARLQPQLNYLTAAPPELVVILGAIYEAHRKGSKLYRSWNDLGLGPTNVTVAMPAAKQVYRRADELVSIDDGGIRVPSGRELERSSRQHNRLQNQAADWLTSEGFEPFGSQPLDPLPVDIQWINGAVHVVGEVKSLKRENEVAQMRRGIGQVLHYKKLFEDARRSGKQEVEAALIVSRKPDRVWVELCADLRIRLAWPSQFGNLTYRIELDSE